MAPLSHDQDISSWLQLLSAIEDADAGRGTARLTEICLSVYGALADARFQITQLQARVHALAASERCQRGNPVAASGPRLPRPARANQHPTKTAPWACQPARRHPERLTIMGSARTGVAVAEPSFSALERAARARRQACAARWTGRPPHPPPAS